MIFFYIYKNTQTIGKKFKSPLNKFKILFHPNGFKFQGRVVRYLDCLIVYRREMIHYVCEKPARKRIVFLYVTIYRSIYLSDKNKKLSK